MGRADRPRLRRAAARRPGDLDLADRDPHRGLRRPALDPRAGRRAGRLGRVPRAAARLGARHGPARPGAEPGQLLRRDRDPLDPALHPLRDQPAPREVARVGAQVPDRRLARLGDAALRDGLPLRRLGLDRLRRDRRGDRPGRACSATRWSWSGSRWSRSGSPSRPRSPPSTSGRPTSTRARRPRSPASWRWRPRRRPSPSSSASSTSRSAPQASEWQPALAVLAAISIVIGNVGALGQDSLKRLLGYSGHRPGRLHPRRPRRRQRGRRQRARLLPRRLRLHEPRRLRRDRRPRARDRPTATTSAPCGASARERPLLAWPLTISMLGLAGLPATVGFIGKLYLIEALVEGDYTWLAVFIAVGTMISLAYYLRVVAAMWMRPGGEAARRDPGDRRRLARGRPDRPRGRPPPLPRRPGPARRRRRSSSSASSRSRWSSSPNTPAPRCSDRARHCCAAVRTGDHGCR